MKLNIIEFREICCGVGIGILIGILVLPYDATFIGCAFSAAVLLLLTIISIQPSSHEKFCHKYEKYSKQN